MHLNNVIHRNDYERLQVELLKAEVDLKKEQAEEQRIANVIQRTLHKIPEKILQAPATSSSGFWGGISLPANDHYSLY